MTHSRRSGRAAPLGAAALLAVSVAFSSLAPAGGVAGPAPRVAATIDTGNREQVSDAYLDWLAPTESVEVARDARVSTCDPGTPGDAYQAATVSAVNFMRALAGEDAVSLDVDASVAAQQAALMMDANDDLDHTPPASWKCYSAQGAAAAGRSNLALGAGGPAAVGLYLRDDGANNVSAGHRWWVLTPDMAQVGSGSTSSANALTVVETARNPAATSRELVAWPTAGYFPTDLEPGGRWSLFAYSERYDLSAARASVVTSTGAALRIRQEDRDLDRIVWDVGEMPRVDRGADATYTVTVSGIKLDENPLPPYSYRTTLFLPHRAYAWTREPTATGSHRVGERLVANAGTITPNAGGRIEYRWYDETGTFIGGRKTLKLQPETLGRTVTLEIVADPEDEHRFTARDVVLTGPVRKGTMALTRKPVIRGARHVGGLLRVAKAARWSAPGKDTITWLGGTKVVGRGASYTITRRDARKVIRLAVTRKARGYRHGHVEIVVGRAKPGS